MAAAAAAAVVVVGDPVFTCLNPLMGVQKFHLDHSWRRCHDGFVDESTKGTYS